MPFEVEMKFRGVDHRALRDRLAALGAESIRVEEQEDGYLSHPARDFRQSGEALRIRRVGEENRITYKGPKRPGPTKTREEIELAFEGGPEAHDQLARLFEHLGFGWVQAVRKRREIHGLSIGGRHLEVGLDRVERLGDFVEVETIARDERDLEDARRAVQGLAERLGLDADALEPRSYLGMLLSVLGSATEPA